MDMKHVETGKSGDREKKKRGRKPNANRQTNRIMFRLNSADMMKRLLAMYEKSGKKSIPAFLADCVLKKPVKTVVVNKSVIDFVIMLSTFFAQSRAVKNNYNQVYHALIRNFGEQKARTMMRIVEQSTLQFGILKRDFEEHVTKLREKCLPK
jgi:hypothetical protein